MSKSENKQKWEEAEFPILCETCLGDNPYVRMMKQNYAKECKVCSRPFTVFRWCPGAGMRYKKTEICQTCAKIKNVCQTCLLDLQYNLPVQVRDAALKIKSDAPRSDINREYYAQNIENQLTNGDSSIDYDKAELAGREFLKKSARYEPYYKRNRAHLCSFFVKGMCNRGDECPYRHELPEDNELSHQNIKDRYYGSNDPVAKKILARANTSKLNPPSDPTITSIFLHGITEEITEPDLHDYFYAFGELKSIVLVYKSKCAFVNFVTRASAEQAIEKTMGKVNIKDIDLKVMWGRPRPQGPNSEVKPVGEGKSESGDFSQPPPPPGGLTGKTIYPSQDPTQLGSRTN
ncbi:Pre-mRNA-splicing factor slt11 [Basidiobolus ranarum]|uniref:Pre-mRNA-splicing factor slt11 n=1 Tax=Basidiobolus ranarum TaxID=34480 RepID=A0ABR2W2W0_9FUNG